MGKLVALEQLDSCAAEWLAAERERGLIDVKFFPGCERDVLDRAALKDFLGMMTCRNEGEFVDITAEAF